MDSHKSHPIDFARFWLRKLVAIGALAVCGPVSGTLAVAQPAYDGLARVGQVSESIESRFAPPPGFTRITVDAGSYASWLRGLPLLPTSTPATDWQDRHVFNPDEVGGVLDWRLLGSEEQCADIALRLLAEHTRASGGGTSPVFHSLSGQEIGWTNWLKGTYGTNRNQTAIVYRPGGVKEPTRAEYDDYLSFVMNYTNTASMSRDWPEISEPELRIGDVIIQPHCTGPGMGHLSVVVDAAQEDQGGRRYIFIDGYTPARYPVVRQRLKGQPETVWMTTSEYLTLQAQFGPGKFHRFPGW